MRKALAVANICVAIWVTFRVLQILTGYADYTDIVDRVLLGVIMGGAVVITSLEWIAEEIDKLVS